MDSKEIYSVGGRNKSDTIDLIEYEERNPKTKKFIKVTKGNCDICDRFKSQLYSVND